MSLVRVVAYIRPHRLEAVKTAVAALGISGLSVANVRGTGNSPERSDLLGGDPALIALPIRARLEVVVPVQMGEEVAEAIRDNAWTGASGDGKIFIEQIADAIRIRTGDRGVGAV